MKRYLFSIFVCMIYCIFETSAQGVDPVRKTLELKLEGGKDYRTSKEYLKSMDLRLRMSITTDDAGKSVLLVFIYDHNDKQFVPDWSIMGNDWIIIRSDEVNSKDKLISKGEVNIYANTEHGPRGFNFRNYEIDGKLYATRISIDDITTGREIFSFFAYPQTIGASYPEDPMLYINWILLQAKNAGVAKEIQTKS